MLAERTRDLLAHPDFLIAVEGHIPGEDMDRVEAQLRALSEIAMCGAWRVLAPARIRRAAPVFSAGVQRRCVAPVRSADEKRRRVAPASVSRPGSAGADQVGLRRRVRGRALRSIDSLRRQDSPAIWTISTLWQRRSRSVPTQVAL